MRNRRKSDLNYTFKVILTVFIIKIGYFFCNDTDTDNKINGILDNIQENINTREIKSKTIKKGLLTLITKSYRKS